MARHRHETARPAAGPGQPEPARPGGASPAGLLQALVFYALVGIVALAPLPLGSNRPGSWSALALGVGVLLLLWGLASILGRRQPSCTPLRHYAWMLAFALPLTGWFLLQAQSWTPSGWHHPLWAETAELLGQPLAGSISIDPAATLDATMRFLCYAGIFFLAMQLGRHRRRARLMLLSVVAAGTAYALYGLAVTFGDHDMILWYERWAYPGSLTSTFVSRNAYASYAGLALLATVALLIATAQRARGEAGDAGTAAGLLSEGFAARLWLPATAAMVLAGSLMLSHSRAGLAAAAAGLLILALLQLRRGAGRSRRSWLVAAVLLGAVVAVGGGTTFQRLQSSGIETLGNRLLLFRDSIDGIAARPWTGSGYGTFAGAFESLRSSPLLDAGVVDKAHNSYLEFALEAGLPALAVMLALLGGIVLTCWRGCARRRRDQIYPMLAIAAAGLIGLHSLIDFPVQIPAVAALFAFLLGLGTAQSLPGEPAAGQSIAGAD